MTSEVGSFAQKTILHRKPKIIDDVIAGNDYPPIIVEHLRLLKKEILHDKVQPLTEKAADAEEWNSVWQKSQGRTWLNLPWYFAESFFYRRLLEETEYFQVGQLRGCDPFQLSKREQLKESISPLSVALEAMERIRDPQILLETLLHASLWGNRVDLSNLTVEEEVRRRQAIVERENLLIDDYAEVREVLEEHPLQHVAFINDNVGMELGFDLFLADFLLRKSRAERVTFFLKPYPFFVSDAMPRDLHEALKAFVDASCLSLNDLGKHMQAALLEGKFCLSSDWFWASPYHFCEMPKRLYEAISRLDMVILKGDVNYRRLLSDRHWPYTTPIERIVRCFPSRLLILRTLKSEIVVGLREGQAEQMEAEDPEWLINGERGIIQYVERTLL